MTLTSARVCWYELPTVTGPKYDVNLFLHIELQPYGDLNEYPHLQERTVRELWGSIDNKDHFSRYFSFFRMHEEGACSNGIISNSAV